MSQDFYGSFRNAQKRAPLGAPDGLQVVGQDAEDPESGFFLARDFRLALGFGGASTATGSGAGAGLALPLPLVVLPPM